MNNLLQNFPGHTQIFCTDFTVRYSEVNQFGTIKMQSIFDYLQQIAAVHANSLGFGMNDLYSKGMIWVLSKISVRIMGKFKPEQQITACTYPSGVEKIFFRREFEIFDKQNGEVLLQASSYWLLLDAKKLRPLRRDVLANLQLENPDLPVFVPQFPSPDADLQEPQKIYTSAVKFSQMDINQHMNNAQYASLAEDAIYEKIQKDFFISEINAAFLKAQKYPDNITTSIAINEAGNFNIQSINQENNCTAFTAFGKISRN